MSSVKCRCGANPRESCPVCEKWDLPAYWCGICGQVVADKRCPLCGLKARKMRMDGGEKRCKAMIENNTAKGKR